MGKFIVIDGTDGSGKATQTALLKERLKQAGKTVVDFDFPQYGHHSAFFVETYLKGLYGDAQTVGPYRAAIFYACDRYDASFNLREALAQDKIVIANRYVTSNLAHQGGKIADPAERQKFFDWVLHLEYDIFQIPRPDLNLILHVPAAVGQELVDHKDARAYIDGQKRDIHEDDLHHLEEAEKVYVELAKLPGHKLISCAPEGQILSREAIAELVWQEISFLL